MHILALYWKQIVVAVALVAAFTFGFYKGYSGEHTKFVEYKAVAEEKAKAQEKLITRIQTASELKTQSIESEYKDDIEKLNKHYRDNPNIKWVRVSKPATCGVPEVPDTAGRVDEDTESHQADTTGVTPLDCAQDVLQLLKLQDWTKEQQGIFNAYE